MSSVPPYESPRLQSVLGPALRPGGLWVTRRAADLCRFSDGDRVVDLGCGLGATVGFLHHRRMNASGLDCSASMLAEARSRNPSARFVRAEAERLPFRAESLDGIFCECVFSLLRNPTRALGEIHRVLVDGGRWVLSDLYLRPRDKPPAVGCAPSWGCPAGARFRDRLDRMLQDAGFSILAWEDHTDRLKHLAAELVFAGIPLAESFACPPPVPTGRTRQALPQHARPAQPGFALWILQKEYGRG